MERKFRLTPPTVLSVAVLTAALAAAACSTSGGSTKDYMRQQRADKTAAALDSRDFSISVSTAHTLRGRMITLSGGYEIELRGDSLCSYLPYFGRAYRPVFGNSPGLSFSSRVTDYASERTAKGLTRITFTADSGEDRYRYRIEVTPDGMATIDVAGRDRDRISFSGEMACGE